MKRFLSLLAAVLLLTHMLGCTPAEPQCQIVATTLPVYEFTTRLCGGTGLSVGRLVTENVSCLHDYSLSVRQVKAVEGAQTVILSGGGLEDFMEDILGNAAHVTDSASGISLLCAADDHDHDHDHHHEHDPHLWLSPEYAKQMAQNICNDLKARYPLHSAVFDENLETLLSDLDTLLIYGQQQLSSLSCRELITFHDGFSYLADAFDLTILKAIEEESGSEASAAELKELILLVKDHGLPAVFTEKSGSTSAAGIIAAETGVKVFALDMAMSGDSYFAAMYHNIDTIKEALE